MGKCFLNDKGGLKIFPLLVHTSAGVKVTLTRGTKKYETTADSNGSACFALSKGTWTISLNDGISEKVASIDMTENKTFELLLNKIPEFTYSGDYETVSDSGTSINYSNDNWEIRFLTSGELNFTSLNGASDGIEVFCVGGGGHGGKAFDWSGGGGGGGGYIVTETTLVSQDKTYDIVIGGGSGNTTAFGFTALAGGAGGDGQNGTGHRAPGGGGTGSGGLGGNDKSNGANGQDGLTAFNSGTGILYGAGGGGGRGGSGGGAVSGIGGKSGGGNGGGPNAGMTNTGGGGGGGAHNAGFDGGSGGSGIVIIRNKRQEV